jgi:hypothetical protein
MQVDVEKYDVEVGGFHPHRIEEDENSDWVCDYDLCK